jgi:hypothetical protein
MGGRRVLLRDGLAVVIACFEGCRFSGWALAPSRVAAKPSAASALIEARIRRRRVMSMQAPLKIGPKAGIIVPLPARCNKRVMEANPSLRSNLGAGFIRKTGFHSLPTRSSQRIAMAEGCSTVMAI